VVALTARRALAGLAVLVLAVLLAPDGWLHTASRLALWALLILGVLMLLDLALLGLLWAVDRRDRT
jgi:hypothetical protein